MDIEVNVADRVLKPVPEVFAALTDPAKLAKYFVSWASGPLKAGTSAVWEFADVGARLSVDVLEIVENRKIVFEWPASNTRTRVTLSLKAVDARTTLVTINESGWPMDRAGVQRALGQTAGWTYVLCCLKAYLQHGINLRLGLTTRLTEVGTPQDERIQHAA